MKFLTIDDFDFENKKVLVRVDINSPVNDGKVIENPRFEAAANTIKELAEKAAVCVIGHQGRKGDKDYTELEQHTELLKKFCPNIRYVDDLFGSEAVTEIKGMKKGDIIVLKNVRSWNAETAKISAEEHSKSELVLNLEPLFDAFVLDAFSIAHRCQASVVGFTIPNIAGRTMQKELEGLSKIEGAQKPYIYVLGGAKPDDVFQLLKYGLETGKVDKVLTAGLLARNLQIDLGFSMPKEERFLDEEGYRIDTKEALQKFSDKIETPIDMAYKKDGKRAETDLENAPDEVFFDIGTKTAEKYAGIIKDAKTVYFKGTMGLAEDEKFRKGTQIVMQAIADSDSFSILGGGHSLTALDELGIDKSKISHISLAGGALVRFMQGKELPGIKALKNSYEKFK